MNLKIVFASVILLAGLGLIGSVLYPQIIKRYGVATTPPPSTETPAADTESVSPPPANTKPAPTPADFVRSYLMMTSEDRRIYQAPVDGARWIRELKAERGEEFNSKYDKISLLLMGTLLVSDFFPKAAEQIAVTLDPKTIQAIQALVESPLGQPELYFSKSNMSKFGDADQYVASVDLATISSSRIDSCQQMVSAANYKEYQASFFKAVNAQTSKNLQPVLMGPSLIYSVEGCLFFYQLFSDEQLEQLAGFVKSPNGQVVLLTLRNLKAEWLRVSIGKIQSQLTAIIETK
jgi:hypothetical protein